MRNRYALERSRFRIALLLTLALASTSCITVLEEGGYEWGWDTEEESTNAPLWQRLKRQLARNDPGAAEEFFGRTIAALHGNDVERLAQMGDTAHWVSERATWLPGVRDYADWLDSRQEYFIAARQAEEVAGRVKVAADDAARAAAPKVALPNSEGTRAPIVGLPTKPPVRRPNLPPVPTAFSRSPLPVASEAGVVRGKRRERVETGRAYWRSRMTRKNEPRKAESVLPAAKAAFRAEGLPEELVWMAEVESAMNPTARSPVGAVGLFQLMPQTAVSLGLKLQPKDERLDPSANAKAAARYLRTLHERFDSWPLTLAAYNAGQGRVGSLCKKHGQSFDAIASKLPLETRLYVPRVMETIRIRTSVDPETLPGPR